MIKTLTVLTASLGATFVVQGQGYFQVQNFYPPAGVDAPVFGALGVPLSGSNYLAELWGGATPDSLAPAVDFNQLRHRIITPFLIDGYFDSRGAVVLETVRFEEAWLQVRAWDARLGSTYEEVVALDLGGYGESPVFLAEGNPVFSTPHPPAPLIGLQSFSLREVVPEPRSWALLALAGVAAFWIWRSPRRRGPQSE